MELIFNTSKISRTTTRREWQDIWRWKRNTERELRRLVILQTANLIAFGSTWTPERRADVIDALVNPPIMIYPEQS